VREPCERGPYSTVLVKSNSILPTNCTVRPLYGSTVISGIHGETPHPLILQYLVQP
jgi:hypothetical protein